MGGLSNPAILRSSLRAARQPAVAAAQGAVACGSAVARVLGFEAPSGLNGFERVRPGGRDGDLTDAQARSPMLRRK